MNSEELEQSLRAEFESYLKGVLAKMREDVNEFQNQIESVFEKHKSQIGEAFQTFSDGIDRVPDFDGGFRESVIEHLRLARDEGAQITATAMAKAEDLERASAPEAFDLNEIKDALNDISSKDSQSAILKSLIQHASKYTPRGAFFIIKNEQFAGWKVFGKEVDDSETGIRDIHFPVASDSILGAAVNKLGTVEGSFGSYGNDAAFLDPLRFGQPDTMYAVPLIARGRGVAVLYSDYGHEGVTVNTDALEMLVKVAGLTVELLASANAVRSDVHHEAPAKTEQPGRLEENQRSSIDSEANKRSGETGSSMAQDAENHFGHASDDTVSSNEFHHPNEPAAGTYGARDQDETVNQLATADHREAESDPTFEETENDRPAGEFDFSSGSNVEHVHIAESSTDNQGRPAASETSESFVSDPVTDTIAKLDDPELANDVDSASSAVQPSWSKPIVTEPDASIYSRTSESEMVFDERVPQSHHDIENRPDADLKPSDAFQGDHVPFTAETPSEPNAFDPTPFDGLAAQFETIAPVNGDFSPVSAPAVETFIPKPVSARLSDRNVDLPIEVAEDERRLHNDARRFARLLVSEIKLYNEKKVQEGRESSDLYERLREAIDRSREMYDKRVQPPVASKFDYFHYELVNSLAEGLESRLGKSYKGASI